MPTVSVGETTRQPYFRTLKLIGSLVGMDALACKVGVCLHVATRPNQNSQLWKQSSMQAAIGDPLQRDWEGKNMDEAYHLSNQWQG